MHSRIFQVNIAPIDKSDYIDESYYYDHWFLNSVADYVNECTNRNDDIKWLKGCYENKGLSFGKDDNGEYFIVEDKAKYFESNFEEFQKALKELSERTFDDFINGVSGIYLDRIDNSYDDKYGFYVEDEFRDCASFDRFMRYAAIGTKYYIGATIDYHC